MEALHVALMKLQGLSCVIIFRDREVRRKAWEKNKGKWLSGIFHMSRRDWLEPDFPPNR